MIMSQHKPFAMPFTASPNVYKFSEKREMPVWDDYIKGCLTTFLKFGIACCTLWYCIRELMLPVC